MIGTINEILNLSDEKKILLQLKANPYFKKIGKKEFLKIAYKGAACGKEIAQQLSRRFPNASLHEVLKQLDIQYKLEPLTCEENFISLATFQTPNEITVNKLIIDNNGKYYEKYQVECFNPCFWIDIVTAHELFHYFQEQEPNLFVNTYKLPLWRLGPYVHATKLEILSEVAAMAFAQEFLKLPFYPGLLDQLLIYPSYPERAKETLKELLKEAS